MTDANQTLWRPHDATEFHPPTMNRIFCDLQANDAVQRRRREISRSRHNAAVSATFFRRGRADCRQALAEPVDDRLFFAGEACSRGDFSTAHGAFLTGVAAADRVIAVRSASHQYGLTGD